MEIISERPPPALAQLALTDLERRLHETQVALAEVERRLAHLKAELRAVSKAERKGQDVADLLAVVKQDCVEALRRRDSLTQELTCLLEEHTLAEQRVQAEAKVAERLALEEAIATFRQDTAALVTAVHAALIPVQEQADALEVQFRHLASRWSRQQRGEPDFGRRLHLVRAALTALRDLLAD
jgi:predicted  nucleic acid-binding Zn-ribbon protein